MNSRFYLGLARDNIKKNARLFTPFILMNIGIVSLFFIMHTISRNPGLSTMSGGDSLKIILGFGNAVIGIFSTIFIFYTNSFLMKRRKKEMGLYNILGMEKKHLAVMLFIETFMISVLSIAIGVLIGSVFSKLMYMVLLKLLGFTGTFSFVIPMASILMTFFLFGCIFMAAASYNTWHIHLSRPIELIRGGNVGEREPKTKWLMTLVGVVSLSAGYGIAITVENPLQAIQMFFVAVILVMIGTYALFTAGSIALLKFLRSRKSFYYQPSHFISVSGMIYRMKQNAVGLANICILSTAVLVTLSTTVSLYLGLEESLDNQYPLDVVMYSHDNTSDPSSDIAGYVASVADEVGVKTVDAFGFSSVSTLAKRYSNGYEPISDGNFNDSNTLIIFVPVADLNQVIDSPIALAVDEVALFNTSGNLDLKTLTLGDQTFDVVREVETFGNFNQVDNPMFKELYVFIKDMTAIEEIYKAFATEEFVGFDYQYMFDLEAPSPDFEKAIRKGLPFEPHITYMGSKSGMRENFFSTYGGFLFLGLFLGTLFMLATVMIIYYKQISEGYDDQNRFDIMQKVGLSKREIKRSIKSQIVMVFFLPLLTAMVHIVFAFPVITKLLALFSFTNTALFILCTAVTLLVFAIIYFAVYNMTARAYYRIVNG